MRARHPAEAAERFYAYLEEWLAQQRAQHGTDLAKVYLRAYLDGVYDSIKVVGEFGPAGLQALHLVVEMVQTNVLSVACPTCGAEIEDLCWSHTRPGSKIAPEAHPDRLRAARGEYVPQSLDRWLGNRRQQASETEKKRGWRCHTRS
jgi:hypothetical protein